MAKLTTAQWTELRAKWEGDEREGFQWLAQDIEVSRQVIARRAEKENWQKKQIDPQAECAKKGAEATEKGAAPTKKGAQKAAALHEEGAAVNEKGAQKGALKRCAPTLDSTMQATHNLTNNAMQDEVKRGVGRPSAYHSSYAEVANKLCLAFGATDAQLADWFGVSEQTVNAWKGAHPEFLESIKHGKTLADANVALALYERATGYSHPDVQVSVWQGEAIVTPITKHYPPDVGAAKYWLNNRQPERWRNQVEIEVSRPSTVASVEVLDAIYEAGIQHAQQSREEMQLRRLQLAQEVVQVNEPQK